MSPGDMHVPHHDGRWATPRRGCQLRSWLCDSALHERLPAKALETRCDVALLDLEDSVLPQHKAAAREAVVQRLTDHPALRAAVRLNTLSGRDGIKDLLALVEAGCVPELLILSKPSLSAHLELACSILREAGAHARLFPIIETPRALWELGQLATAPEMLGGVIFGAADFASEMGLDPDEAAFATSVRTMIALHAQRLRIDAIDSPCFAVNDEEAVAAEAMLARRLGYIGKIAIHPRQVATLHRHFTPSSDRRDHARALLQAQADQAASATFLFQDRMVGPPFLKQARALCAQAEDMDVAKP